MMSDNAVPTCKQGDGIGLVSGSNIMASQSPYMGHWMAHWQASRSSPFKDCQIHTDSLTGNILQLKGLESLALDQVKSKEFELVRVDMNRRYSFGGKGKSNSASEDDTLSYAIRSGETSKVDRGKLKSTENSSIGSNVESINDKTVFSEKVSTQQLIESSIKWKNSGSYCCHSVDVSDSDFEHFPMLDINRKIETVLASKKKSAYDAVSVKMVKENLSLCESIGTSSLLDLAPVSCLAAKKIIGDAKKVMTNYEGFLPDNAEDMGGVSSPVIHGCKYQKANMVSCMFSSGLTYVDPINNKLTTIKHNLCSCCSSSKSMTTGIKSKTGLISKGFGNSWTSQGESIHLLGESGLTDYPYSFSTEGRGSEIKGNSSSQLLSGQRRLSKPDDTDVNLLPCKMPSIHDISLFESCQNLKSVDIGEQFQKFSSTIKYLLISDKVGKYQCPREQTMKDSAFTQVNGSVLSKSHAKKEKSTAPLSIEDGNDCDDTGTHLVGESNKCSIKADTIYNHPFHGSSSLVGESFSRPQKGVTSSNLRNSIPPSASSREVASRNVETGMAQKREVEQRACLDKTAYASHKEASVSSTESLSAEHIVSHVKVSNFSSSSPSPDYTSGSENCSRWIKRLHDNHSETLSLCPKRFKKGDDSSREIHQTFSRIQNCKPLNHSSFRFMKEQGKCEKAMTLSGDVLPSGDSEESVQLWMRRWRRSDNGVSQNTSRSSVALTFHPEKLRTPLEKFEEKISASIGAMALMGKAMNNNRPCRFRREEGSLVWNNEE